ncbi:MAG TPA: hypothetical protein VIX40_00140 [Methylomirabilota bacterium]
MGEPLQPPAAPPPAAPPPSGVSPNRQVMIVLSYIGLLALIPLLSEKEDREVQWHAKHGLVLFVAWIVLMVATQVVIIVLNQVSNSLGCLVGMATPFVGLAYFVVTILCILKGVKGERFQIPGLSPLVDRF